MGQRWVNYAQFMVFGLAIVIALLFMRSSTPASAAPLAAPTPGPGAMTDYTVTNSNSVTITVENVFTNTTGFSYVFWSTIPANSTANFYLSQISQIPSPFTGTLNLYSNQPFTAQVTGYDYPGSPTVTPTATPTSNASPTATATSPVLGTATATPTATATSPVLGTVTATPTAPPSSVLFSDGFEESSFSAGGWVVNVNGTGSAAQLVTAPVWSGNQAASFSTQTQQSGQSAVAEARISWPASNVETAQAMVQPQVTAVQINAKIFSLETKGPNPWMPRAGFGLGPSTFEAIYATSDNVVHYQDTGVTYQFGRWYNLQMTVDYRGINPSFTFVINGQTVYTTVDTTAGSNTDRPAALDVGFGPGSWGGNSGAVVFDQVVDVSGSSVPTLTPTATTSSSPTSTPTPSAMATSTTPTLTATSVASPTATPTKTITPRPNSPSPTQTSGTPTTTPIATRVTNTPPIFTTVIANASVQVLIPPQAVSAGSIAQVVVSEPASTPVVNPSNGSYEQILAITIDATDDSGKEVHQLAVPATISITFTPLPGTNPSLAQIATVDSSGNTEILATQIVNNGDGTYTAIAQTPHFSSFTLSAPSAGALVRQIFIPAASSF